mmetsp:Transcript_66032/g.185870  ORF Transcript_66032/g.185870 Transcript_66032/m.185870 type:complete len:388 (-) Transcript_66032:299-1462(-)
MTKRPHDGLDVPTELTPGEASAVDAAVEQWGRAKARRVALRPVLQREQELIKEIQTCGFNGGDLKTWRWLATGGGHCKGEEEALRRDVVAAGMVANAEKLRGILRENHRALVELTARVPQDREDILRELDEARATLRTVQTATHGKLLRAKAGSDQQQVRSLGRSLNDLRALLRKLEADRHEVTRNSRLAALLVLACRHVLPAREVDPAELHEIPPSREGYFKILDFYFFSDASKYCFEEHYSGPNWFTRLKRNIAIFAVADGEGKPVYNQFAVSGVHKKPGAPLVPEVGHFTSTNAEDEHGRVFDRHHDAEFKLLNDFAHHVSAKSFAGCATLWTSKALCKSCAGAVVQFRERFPAINLKVAEGCCNLQNTTTSSPGLSGGDASHS